MYPHANHLRYHDGMTMTQITVRIPSDLAAFIDGQVSEREAASRAAVVTKALRREQRRSAAEHDAMIYATTSEPEDLVGLAEYAATVPLDID
jgi:Arc/MetJ-type ribon-helix-helix transcriptional regulator